VSKDVVAVQIGGVILDANAIHLGKQQIQRLKG
jgi:hypothetical protein